MPPVTFTRPVKPRYSLSRRHESRGYVELLLGAPSTGSYKEGPLGKLPPRRMNACVSARGLSTSSALSPLISAASEEFLAVIPVTILQMGKARLSDAVADLRQCLISSGARLRKTG